MTNREKYPKTEDALAAFRKHKEEHNCDCTFDLWLKMPCDEELSNSKAAIMMGLAGLSLLDSLSKGIYVGKDEEAKSTVDNSGGIGCPLCHKKNGEIGGILTPVFKCPDCGAIIGCRRIEGEDAFVKWFSQFSKKQD